MCLFAPAFPPCFLRAAEPDVVGHVRANTSDAQGTRTWRTRSDGDTERRLLLLPKVLQLWAGQVEKGVTKALATSWK